MNRKRKIRQMRKESMRIGTIESSEVLKESGMPKKKWGYVVHALVNGEHISAVDDSWYEAYIGCLECARWLSTQNTPLE